MYSCETKRFSCLMYTETDSAFPRLGFSSGHSRAVYHISLHCILLWIQDLSWERENSTPDGQNFGHFSFCFPSLCLTVWINSLTRPHLRLVSLSYTTALKDHVLLLGRQNTFSNLLPAVHFKLTSWPNTEKTKWDWNCHVCNSLNSSSVPQHF